MSDEAKAVIVQHLADGASVEDAYRQGASRLLGQHGSRVDSGMPSADALASLGIRRGALGPAVPSPGWRPDHEAMFLVASGGGVGSIPSSSCMEQQLRGKQRTQKNIEDAIAHCRT